jgi:hypothetical protein
MKQYCKIGIRKKYPCEESVVLKLSIEKFLGARNYLMKYGRDLEQELLRFHFENSSPKSLIDVMNNYQGEDGGFRNLGEGHPIYTNAMDTTMAFQYLSEIGATANDEIVQRAIKYIINSYDHDLKCWHPRHNETNIGWHDNPCAEMVGYLYEYRELVPDNFFELVTETAMKTIRNNEKTFQQCDFLDVLCILRLATRIDEPFRTEILNRVKKDIHEIIETNPVNWATTYSAKPFFFAHSPNSPLFETIKVHVIRSLENEIITQAEEGNFILNWAVQDEESARIWKSIWTMDALRSLHHHDMIAILNG